MADKRRRETGRYQEMLSRQIKRTIEGIEDDLLKISDLDPGLVADRASVYLSEIVRKAIASAPENERNAYAKRLINSIVEEVASDANGLSDWKLLKTAELQAVGFRDPSGVARFMPSPMSPLVDNALHTNAKREPNLISQLVSEIESSDQVDIIMAFVRQTGVNYLREPLQRLSDRGGRIRILTTTYTQSTEAKALGLLQNLGAQIKISYDTTSTRLHAKSWIFRRSSSISTVYIGSSNLSHSAQVDGIEWNVRLSERRNPEIVARMQSLFDSYWSRQDFEDYDEERFASAVARKTSLGPDMRGLVGINLKPFQEAILDQVSSSREWGHHKNLIVAATGTGKTVMAAVDFQRLMGRGFRRLLFIAHRREILEQSITTFRQAVGDFSLGEMWVGGKTPRNFEQLFASIQTLNQSDLELFSRDYFDVLIIDEFHHASASSYRRILDYFEPKEILGLTATPERSDGQDILSLFGGRIAGELRLWDAIDQQYLTPFHYFGIADGTDLSRVSYRPGRGYDTSQLANVFTGNHAWMNFVLKTLLERVDLDKAKGLAFCVNVDHAKFVANALNSFGISAEVVTGSTPEALRSKVVDQLRNGELKFAVSVDVFNEGVDLPSINTILMLRPTESATVFLQQLGRGLRKSPEKSVCTVLDFVGNHRSEVRFDKKYSALLNTGKRNLEDHISQGFPLLPSGCFMHMDKVASEIVLRSLKTAIPSSWNALVASLRQMVRDSEQISLVSFLSYSGLALEDIYRNGRSWSDLLEAAGAKVLQRGPYEEVLRKAAGRLLHIDDKKRLVDYTSIVTGGRGVAESVQRMLLTQLWRSVEVVQQLSVRESLDELLRHSQVCAELAELFGALAEHSSHPHSASEHLTGFPLQLHARYTREEIQSAVGLGFGAAVPSWREGVRWDPKTQTDLLLFTLNKSLGAFSPSTSYRDFALAPDLIHWESQSTTSEESPVGRRYQSHVERGSQVLLFARLTRLERGFWFLGPASYQMHEGSRPMAITWKLMHPLPADLYQEIILAAA